MNYISDRVFKIWAYTVSHCILLLRSSQLLDDVDGYSASNNYNIDIEFWGVGYIDLPDILRGVSVQEIKKDIPKKFSTYQSSGYKIFTIKSGECLFFVVASGFRVGKNSWISEDRISNLNLEYDEIIASS